MVTLKFRAMPGSMLSDPSAPGRYLGRTALPTPADGWPAGTKPEARCPIDPAGGSVDKSDKKRFVVVLDALRKAVDLEPMDKATADYCGLPFMPAAPKAAKKVSE